MSQDVVIIGAGGHAKVIADIVLLNNDNLVGFLDDSDEKQGVKIFKEYRVTGKISDIEKYRNCCFIIAIGDNHIRAKIAKNINAKFYTAIHPDATIADTVTIGDGTVIMAGVTINPDTTIGKHCIINTSCSIDHDNRIGDYVHISPGAHLAGSVSVGDRSWICIGAAIINNISVFSDIIIGAGATVLKDVTESGTYIGTPARKNK